MASTGVETLRELEAANALYADVQYVAIIDEDRAAVGVLRSCGLPGWHIDDAGDVPVGDVLLVGRCQRFAGDFAARGCATYGADVPLPARGVVEFLADAEDRMGRPLDDDERREMLLGVGFGRARRASSAPTRHSGLCRPPDASIGAVVESLLRRGHLEHEPTGIAYLDERTGGGLVYGSRVYLLGAPDAGKTLLLVQVADVFAQRGVNVGILAVDEDREDVLQRFLQRRGVTRAECERLAGPTLDAALRDVEALPIRVYDATWTIEQAADDLAAHADGGRCALFIDSVQTARSVDDDLQGGTYANVTARVRAIHACATRHRMLIVSTSEMSRAAYRSRAAAENVTDMAAAKESGAIEYSAKLMLTLRTVPGQADVAELRIAKNKYGPRTAEGDGNGLHLRLFTATQHVAEAEDFAPQQQDGGAQKARAGVVRAAAVAADWLAGNQGAGVRALYSGLESMGVKRAGAEHGLGHLEQHRAIITRPGPGKRVQNYLVGELVPEEVLAELPPERAAAVRAAVPPTPETDPTDTCVDTCVDTPNTPEEGAASRVCAATPIGGGTHTHAAGAAHAAASTQPVGKRAQILANAAVRRASAFVGTMSGVELMCQKVSTNAINSDPRLRRIWLETLDESERAISDLKQRLGEPEGGES